MFFRKFSKIFVQKVFWAGEGRKRCQVPQRPGCEKGTGSYMGEEYLGREAQRKILKHRMTLIIRGIRLESWKLGVFPQRLVPTNGALIFFNLWWDVQAHTGRETVRWRWRREPLGSFNTYSISQPCVGRVPTHKSCIMLRIPRGRSQMSHLVSLVEASRQRLDIMGWTDVSVGNMHALQTGDLRLISWTHGVFLGGG